MFYKYTVYVLVVRYNVDWREFTTHTIVLQLAAISPADVNFDETVSTLRFAGMILVLSIVL